MIKQRFTSLDFDYSLPYPNFDRSKVKGLVASLISLEPTDYNKSTALEITAGGRLYNVVVESEKVGKELLQNGKLKKRVTIIPLNKIDTFKMSAQVREADPSVPFFNLMSCTETPSCNQAGSWQGSPCAIVSWLSRGCSKCNGICVW